MESKHNPHEIQKIWLDEQVPLQFGLRPFNRESLERLKREGHIVCTPALVKAKSWCWWWYKKPTLWERIKNYIRRNWNE